MDTMKKSGFVSLIGRPNVGKSTLMNHLIGQKIAITSDKPQTTRNRIQTVYTDDRGQIVFLDTPGIHKSKNKLGDYMVNVAEHTLKEVDVILWLVEPTTYIGAGEQHIIEKLKQVKTPVILIINKIDTVEKTEILKFIDAYRKVLNFAEIIPVSALKDINTDEVLHVLFKYLEPGPQYFDEDTVTDQPMRQIAAELIREKALRNLSDEIPHGIAVTIESFTERRNGLMDIQATIVCERESHQGYHHRKERRDAQEDRFSGQIRDRGSDGNAGEPADLGQGSQGMAGQRALSEELRLPERRCQVICLR